MLAFDPRPFSPLDALALNPFCALDPLALNARAFRSLNALAFNPGPLSPLSALALNTWPLRPLDTLALNTWSLGPLDTLAFDARPFSPLALRALRTFRLALTLARLRALSAITAIALGIGRACQGKAGDTGDQEKLATHDCFTRSIRTLDINSPDYAIGLCPT
jgi:hypothetical protein